MTRTLRVIGYNILIILALLVAFDVVAYFALPDRIARLFDSYRQWNSEFIGGRLFYPQFYFVAHPERGFDIGPNKKNLHRVEDTTYPIWSNAFGCFDKNNSDIDGAYYYFAGDSLTWGYAPYETKFATVFEKRRGIKTLKCGVTHTGQRHQFSKFKGIAESIGHWPSKVIVGVTTVDVSNDYAYPHSTVIDGWQVDNIYLDARLNKIHVNEKWIREKIAANRVDKEYGIKALLKELSLSANIFNKTIYEVKGFWDDIFEEDRDSKLEITPDHVYPDDVYPDHVYNGIDLYVFYTLWEIQTESNVYKYGNDSYVEPNKIVVKEWAKHAKDNGYELIFLLIPDKDQHANTGFFKELRQFLKANQVSFIDLTYEFKKRNLEKSQLYWPNNTHFSPSGNVVVGEILSDLIE